MGMSEFYGARDDRESTATIHRALDLGVNFLDTADMYLEINVAALEVELTAGDLAELAQAAPVGRTAGARYPASSMAAVNR
jgi:aryl-alcohol dehydrogenase-like predicted oxidoreductase